MNNLEFKSVTIEDRDKIELYFSAYSSFCLSTFTFSSLIAWDCIYHYQWTTVQDTLLLKFLSLEDNQEHLMQPIGEFPNELQNVIIHYAQSLPYRLTIFGVSNNFLSKHPQFVSNFEQTDHRNMDNYIYSAEDLALLKGTKYQAKRNLLNQFEAKYHWISTAIDAKTIPECFEVLNTIYHQQEVDKSSYLNHELKVLTHVLNHFPQFKEQGILILIDKRPVAFSIFEQLNPSTCVVHFEKALREYKGLYQLINRETAKIILSGGYKYINREEDLGIEGLRKAKLSYHPLELCPAHALVFRR